MKIRVSAPTRKPPRTFAGRISSLAVASCYAGSVFANPASPIVVSGQAEFLSSANTLSITNSPNAIINWQGFSIRAGELTRFVQQSASSAVLNRVVGQDPSTILGQLQSNGRVFLINPNGITFGPGAQIDVAGLVASSLHLSNADFLAGRLQFREHGGAGKVLNQGEIRTPSGGKVILIAPNVENSGLITTPGGEIVLAAGRSVELADLASPAIRIEIAASAGEALNLGRLIANGGETSAVLGGALLFATTATVSSPAGSYPISVSGATADNYTISYFSGLLNVTSVAATLTARLRNIDPLAAAAFYEIAPSRFGAAGFAASGYVPVTRSASALGGAWLALQGDSSGSSLATERSLEVADFANLLSPTGAGFEIVIGRPVSASCDASTPAAALLCRQR